MYFDFNNLPALFCTIIFLGNCNRIEKYETSHHISKRMANKENHNSSKQDYSCFVSFDFGRVSQLRIDNNVISNK